jgi:hypothetical protein
MNLQNPLAGLVNDALEERRGAAASAVPPV